MRLSCVRAKNFRNLVDIDVPLAQHTVIVGENRSGKSNLLHAMQKANDSLNELAPLAKLTKDIAESTEAAVGANQG